jgi:thiaminase/transcriptional activator TenA
VTLSAGLIAAGRPRLDQQLNHPTVQGIARGDLDDAVFRSWLEQDYLFLLDYVRVFSALAAKAPAAHLGDLVDLAHATFHDELDLHRSLAADFGADLEGAVPGPACTAYTRFLLDAARRDYGEGLAALLPCMWGYSMLAQLMAIPDEPRYRRWLDTYRDPGFAALAARCAEMLDQVAPAIDEATARALFDAALDHELAFWDVP